MKSYIPIVRDIRDAHSAEPESILGTYDTLGDAQDELIEYLQGENGKYIVSARIQVEEE